MKYEGISNEAEQSWDTPVALSANGVLETSNGCYREEIMLDTREGREKTKDAIQTQYRLRDFNCKVLDYLYFLSASFYHILLPTDTVTPLLITREKYRFDLYC